MNISLRFYFRRWLKNQMFLFLIFTILTSAARVAFTLYFGNNEVLTSHTAELKQAFWLGFRFDLIPIAYINVIPFLLLHLGYFIPGKKAIRIIGSLNILLLFTGYIIITWLYIFDYGFYSYFQDHLNILFFGFFEDDTKALLISIYKNYNLPLWLSLLAVYHFGLFKFIKFLNSPFDFDLKSKRTPFFVIGQLFVGLTALAFLGRGNFSRLPLSVEDAHISRIEFINKISLNGALSLNRAIKIRKTFGKDNFNYLKNYGFKNWKDAYRAYFKSESPKDDQIVKTLTHKTKDSNFLLDNPPHVVLAVMESFGSYWNDKNDQKFDILAGMEQHFRDGILFKNFLPAENGTIGSIVSVATGQPIRPGSRFLSESEFMNLKLGSSGHLPFKSSGYETHFVYGGKLGWRDLGKFLTVQNYDKLWGADEIKEAMPELANISPSDLGNEWGIFDEYLYNFVEEQLKTATRPQFFLILTTSNHPPFEYPSTYRPRPIEITEKLLSNLTIDEDLARKRFTCLQYSNHSTSEFINRIKKTHLSEKTIFALTGDHSFWIAKGVGEDKEFKRYAVPFYLRVPEKYLTHQIDTDNFGSHEDIFPTLINLALSGQPYIKLGEDLLNEEGTALNSSGIVANKRGAYHHGRFWKWQNLKKQILTPTESNLNNNLERESKGQIALTDAYLKEEKANKSIDVKDGQK